MNRGDATFELLWIQSVIGPNDRNYWNVDIGEDIGGRAEYHNRADQQDQQGQDDEGVGPVKRYADDPHASIEMNLRY